jgi:hypothetical protein
MTQIWLIRRAPLKGGDNYGLFKSVLRSVSDVCVVGRTEKDKYLLPRQRTTLTS